MLLSGETAEQFVFRPENGSPTYGVFQPKGALVIDTASCRKLIYINCSILLREDKVTWNPNSKEIEAVLRLSGVERYMHFIKKVADYEEIWSLWEAGGWAMASDDYGRELVPVWPHPKYAEKCAQGNWQLSVPRSIELDAWMERWIPGIERDRRLIAVFPLANDKGVVVDPARLAADLNEELTNYE